MSRLLLLGLLAVVAAAAGAAGGAESASRPVVLAVVNGHLGHVDAVTLKPVGASVPVGRFGFPSARSPSGSQVALAASQPAAVRIVDLRTMKRVNTFGLNASEVDALSWVTPRAILGESSVAVYRIDPVRRRVVWSGLLPDGALGLRATPDGFVLLSSPGYDEIGPTTLTTIDAAGRRRSVLLDQIRSGIHETDPNASAVDEQVPGLAVDRATDRAYVVGAGEPVAEVDLKTLAVVYHGGSRTLAKSSTGSWRDAEWAGNGLIAVAGQDNPTADAQLPSGLDLIDTATWTWRQVDPQADDLSTGPGTLLAFETVSGQTLGLAAYDLAGNLRFRLAGTVGGASVASSTAYVWLLAGRTWRLDVLDLATGRVLNSVKSPSFTLLSR